jgi:hypothetical protein
MRTWLLGLAGFAVAALATASVPDAGSPAIKLPPVSVEASRNGDFYLLIDVQPTRHMWLMADPRAVETPAMRRFRGKGLRDGDEIVRIAGRDLADMAPDECLRVFHQAMKKPKTGAWTVEVDVQAKGEKVTRKIILIQAVAGAQIIVPSRETRLP